MLSRTIDSADRTRTSETFLNSLAPNDIADFSDSVMSRLTRDELVRLIDATAAHARLDDPPDVRQLQLRYMESLRRLAYLARFACRNLIRCQPRNGP